VKTVVKALPVQSGHVVITTVDVTVSVTCGHAAVEKTVV
jgi:hypothetical protein